jgi:hypothetical protein
MSDLADLVADLVALYPMIGNLSGLRRVRDLHFIPWFVVGGLVHDGCTCQHFCLPY